MAEGEPWSQDELRHAVDAYAFMLRQSAVGESYSVESVRSASIDGPLSGRSPRAFDMRMGNISHILMEHGEEWLPEFPPLAHVGGNVELEILDMLTDPVQSDWSPGQGQRVERDIRFLEGLTDRGAWIPTQESGSQPQRSNLRSEPRTLEEAAKVILSGITTSAKSKKTFNDDIVVALMLRMGFGSSASTLQEAGDTVGLTRERIRQLEKRVAGWKEGIGHRSLDEAPLVVQKAIHLAWANGMSLRDAFEAGELADGDWTLEALLDLGRLHGLGPLCDRIEDEAGRVIAIRKFCREAVWLASGRSGFAYIQAILPSLNEIISDSDGLYGPVEVDELRAQLNRSESILSLPKDFFSVRDPESVINGTRRMLQVTQPLSVAEIRSGLRRRFTFRKIPFAVTSEVLANFFSQHDAFAIDEEGNVSSAGPLDDPEDTVQMWIVRELASSDYGLLTRNQVVERAVQARQNTSSVNIYLTYGEQIAHDPRGFYYPVGVLPDDDRIVDGLEVAQATYQRAAQAWHFNSAKRVLTLNVELGNTTVTSGVLPADAEARGVLELIADDRYPLYDEEGEQHGSLWRSESFKALGGLSTFLAHKFAEPGDFLQVTFHLDAKRAIARVGGTELSNSDWG